MFVAVKRFKAAQPNAFAGRRVDRDIIVYRHAVFDDNVAADTRASGDGHVIIEPHRAARDDRVFIDPHVMPQQAVPSITAWPDTSEL